MNEANEILFSAATAGEALGPPSISMQHVGTLAAGVAVPSAIDGPSRSAYGPRDFVAITLLIVLFLIIATLGHLAFAVERGRRRWIPVRVMIDRRWRHGPRWR